MRPKAIKVLLVVAALVAGFFASRALQASPPAPVSVSTEADEIAALRALDAEVAAVNEQLEKGNTQRAARGAAILGHARCRLKVPLDWPIAWNARAGKLEIAPVSTETKK